MIKFFRKIRQKLLSENNFNKYLIYAFGEIVLVVFGILIALQINNWNEKEKARTFELKMLSEVKEALLSDLKHSDRMISRVNITQNAYYKILEKIYNNTQYSDSLRVRVYDLITGIQYQQTLGPYEAIKSVGLDKISNDSLRNKLITFYDFDYPRQKELILWYDKSYDTNYKRINDFKEQPEVVKMKNDSLNIISKFSPTIFQNPEFLAYLASVKLWMINTEGVLKYIRPEMKGLIKEIELEINKERKHNIGYK